LRNRGLPRILGSDIAGTVVALGLGCNRLHVGNRVVLYPVLSCGGCSRCQAGDDHLCSSVGVLGSDRDGGYCEFIAVEESRAFALPPAIDLHDAAAVPIVYTTAWQIVRRCRIGPGDAVLVWGATSGLGQATLDVARSLSPGLLITTARSDKCSQVSGPGRARADAVVAYDTEDVAEHLLELTAGRGFDVIVDHVGSATWPISLAVATPGARLAIAGATTGNDAKIEVLQFLAKGLEVHGCFIGSRTDFAAALRAVGVGVLAPHPEILPLSAAGEAHRQLESGSNVGKLVLSISQAHASPAA